MEYLISEEVKSLRGRVKKLVADELSPFDAAIEETGLVPDHALNSIREAGLFGSQIPTEHGGLGLDLIGNCAIVEEMAKAHIAYYYTYSMNVHIAVLPLLYGGSSSQHARWLPGMASGDLIGSYALTEENAGSDAASLQTTAKQDGDHYILNGKKRYITNAPIASLITVFASTDVQKRARGISAFAVPSGTEGMRIGKVFEMAGGRGAYQSEVIFENCRVPIENRIGSEGEGFKLAMMALDAGRINWAAYSVGAAQNLFDLTVKHLTTRKQFGRPLSDNQGIKWRLADMAAQIHSARLTCYDAAWRYENDPKNRAANGATAKLIGADMVSDIADQAVQLFGGEGYRKDRPIERIWREVRVVGLLEGTSEIMREIIGRELLKNRA